jgi:hypothetical protein
VYYANLIPREDGARGYESNKLSIIIIYTLN